MARHKGDKITVEGKPAVIKTEPYTKGSLKGYAFVKVYGRPKPELKKVNKGDK